VPLRAVLRNAYSVLAGRQAAHHSCCVWDLTDMKDNAPIEPGSPELPVPVVPPELAQSCRMGECVLFAGAGLSARAGLPTWNDFLAKLLTLARDRKIIDPAQVGSLEAALREGDRDTVADGVVGAFGSQRELLQDCVSESFPEATLPSVTHSALSQIPFNSVATTNYDNLLEKTFPKFAQTGIFTCKDADSLLDALSQKRQFILKLYGNVDRLETLIFSPIEYREVVSSNVSFSKFMEGFFFSRNFLFIGLSLEGIQDFLSSFTFRGTNPRQHFALVAVAGSAWKAKADLLLRRYNVQVTPFPAAGGFWELDQFVSILREATSPVASAPGAGSGTSPTPIPTPGLRRVILEDIGPFEKLELDFPKEKNWKILLGDNGVGKSTILKAIATAIIGSDARSYAGRLVRAGKTRGRITLITEQNPSGYVTEILTKDMLSEAEVVSIPSRPMEAEGWLALGFSPLRVVTWSGSTGPQPMVQKGRPTADDLIPLLSGETDPRMDHLKQWIVNLDAADKSSHLMGLQELRALQGHEDRVTSIAFSADGRSLVSGSIDKTVRIWDVATGRERRRIAAHQTGVNAVALSGDAKRAASGSFHGTVRVWDSESGTALRSLDNKSQVLSVAMSSDAGTLVAGCEDGSIGIWGRDSERTRLRNHKGEVWSVAMSTDGRIFASGSEDGSVHVWETETGREIRTLVTGSNPVWSVAMCGDGRRLVAGFKDGSVRVWELQTGTEVQVLENLRDEVMAVALAADGRTVVSGSGGGMIKRWDLDPVRQTGVVRAHRSAIWSVAMSPDAQIMASASDDKTIKLWTVTLPEPTLSPFETIKKFFNVVGTLTDRTDIEFQRVTENFRVYVKVAGVTSDVPVEVLSQGLTSLFGWVGVLCQRLKETLQGPTNDPLPTDSYALVLIDELDAHMHPRWQQVLVPRLKKTFPNVQFIACTHSPLIAGGLDKKEVARFSIVKDQIAQVDFDPDMTLGRTDQILTGELFNLSTTLDYATQEVMAEYQTLLGKSARSLEEEQRFVALGRALEERIPPSPSTPVERRAGELLETLHSANLKAIDASTRVQVEERMARLSKTLRRENDS
jgi:WD40 repeat protein